MALNVRTIGRNRMPTCRLKQHFSPTCRRLFYLSLSASQVWNIPKAKGVGITSLLRCQAVVVIQTLMQ